MGATVKPRSAGIQYRTMPTVPASAAPESDLELAKSGRVEELMHQRGLARGVNAAHAKLLRRQAEMEGIYGCFVDAENGLARLGWFERGRVEALARRPILPVSEALDLKSTIDGLEDGMLPRLLRELADDQKTRNNLQLLEREIAAAQSLVAAVRSAKGWA